MSVKPFVTCTTRLNLKFSQNNTVMKSRLLLFLVFTILILSNSFGQSIPDYVSQDQLIGYWPLDANGVDLSPSQNHGTIGGAEACQDRFGNVNHAYSFNGSDQHITCESAGPGGSSDRTVSFWLRVDSIKQNFDDVNLEYIFSYGSDLNGSGGHEFSVFLNTLQCPSIAFNTGSDYLMFEYLEEDFEVWVHFAFVINGNSISNVKMYRNGELSTSGCFTTPNVATIGTFTDRPIHIGTSHKSEEAQLSSRHLAGYLDELAFWSRALTSEELAAYYAGSLITDTPTEGTSSAYQVFPNPASQRITIISPEASENGTVQIFNITGQLVKVVALSGQTSEIDISDIPAGIYHLSVQGSLQRVVVY